MPEKEKSMKTYVIISEQTYPTDTAEEIADAQAALVANGKHSTPVYAGDCDDPDSYLNGQVLFAPEESEEAKDARFEEWYGPESKRPAYLKPA